MTIARNSTTDTVKTALVDNFNTNAEALAEVIEATESKTYPCVMASNGISPTSVTVWRIGYTCFATGYFTTSAGGTNQTVASATGVQPVGGVGDESIQFAASTAESGKSAAGIIRGTSTGFNVVAMTSAGGTYRFCVAFPCSVIGN